MRNDNMAEVLIFLINRAEESGEPPTAIMMNSKSFKEFYFERIANGETIANPRRFMGYPVAIDDSLADYEIFLPGVDEMEEYGRA